MASGRPPRSNGMADLIASMVSPQMQGDQGPPPVASKFGAFRGRQTQKRRQTYQYEPPPQPQQAPVAPAQIRVEWPGLEAIAAMSAAPRITTPVQKPKQAPIMEEDCGPVG